MGILLLPSLEEKRHIILDGVSQTEAEMFITDFTNRVKASRRLSTPKKHIDDEFKIYNLIENVADWDVPVNSAISQTHSSACPRAKRIWTLVRLLIAPRILATRAESWGAGRRARAA